MSNTKTPTQKAPHPQIERSQTIKSREQPKADKTPRVKLEKPVIHSNARLAKALRAWGLGENH